MRLLVGGPEQASLGGDLVLPVLDAGRRAHVGDEPVSEISGHDGVRGDDLDHGLGSEQLPGFGTDSDPGLALVGLVVGCEENLREEGLERPVPANHRANDVHPARLGL